MKYFGLTLLVVLIATTLVSCKMKQDQGKQEDHPAAEIADRKSLNGFGGNLIVVEDPRKFAQDWQRPETPKITRATEVKRGTTIGTIVLFAGCKPNASACNAEVDYTIYKPDGSLFTEQKGQPLWKEAAPPASNFQLGRAILSFQLGQNDHSGEYRVKAKITDLNANITLELETRFRLQ